jgi:hypothetical protein
MERKHFIIAGAQRSGTTTLYHLLSEHPEILMATPLRPEPKFFLEENAAELGRGEYYRRFFPRYEEFEILGEKSTSYLETPQAAERIKACLPNAKIVILLRDPVRRALSHYRFSCESGLESRTLEEVFSDLVDRKAGPDGAKCSVSPFRYLGRGLYINDIPVYETLFGRENLIILILENFNRSESALSNLYQSVGANPDFKPKSFGVKFNESEKEEALPPAIQKKLVNYYRKANDLLAARYGLDLAPWQ